MGVKFKKLLAALLSAVMLVSALTGLSVTAAETDGAEAGVSATETSGEAAEAPAEDPADIPTEEPTKVPTEAPTELTVGRVTNLERTSFESNLCTLTWDAVDGADGYYVYVCNADAGSTYQKVAQVQTNTCTVDHLAQGTQYHFRVSAYVNDNGRIIEGEKTTKKTATQPGALTGLTKWRSSDVIEMTWNRNPKATGYRIYRTSAESGNKEVLYKTIYGNTNTTFTETNVRQGRVYTYRVKSFRELYNTSYSSSAGSMTFMAGLCGPNYTIVSRCQRVNLTWKANPYATHYEVYYSTSPDNATFTKLFTTPRLYYNTTKLTAGKTYYFRVRPIYKSGSTTITGTSNKKSATVVAKAYGKNTGSTYVEVCLAQQHMWVYKNGRQIASTDVVTGNQGSADTPTGYYSIYSKTRSTYLVGPGYRSYVDYWMPFYGGYGIHDSSWRSSYGGTIYKGNGSHGCVNTPKSSMTTIYQNIPTGTPVIIY